MTLPKTLEAHENGRLVWDIAAAADDRKAEDITILKVDQISYLADFFVVVTGFSRTQVRAIADAIEERLETKYGKVPLRMEGKSEGMWILQDYGEVIVHIFLPQEREFYNLEAFWGHAERIEFEPALP
ncbi:MULTISPECIES: ribosome silencing factor [unclassified Picosynechococcus]|uniref:ribosome silencing factor n=1 Tax=unclassified Picosynechococcus TaxID=3079910 RepID=UPI0005EDBB9E|nr:MULTISPECIES: ribosome silencing factor [unclassified Picosynechococcus]ANV86783.1 ribosome silencing factor [Picosynechococcus sp. PCC 7117]ANV89942.1 ribosome silencing factor [Picosynechococcus sp. PCC 8807]QCS49471.1 ribosome silencing factor [Picosynechococcus sp. PCC 11901]